MTTRKQSPYVPSFLRTALESSRHVQMAFADIEENNVLDDSSFTYDAQDAPLKSTQQLNVDWSKFENHTFFMSAEAKVNLAFEQVINGFPFDGTRAETESFFEKMTGFDRWVFDQFPKHSGQLMFSGSAMTEVGPSGGTYIVVKDSMGSMYPELSKKTSGASALNPTDTSLSIEVLLNVPTISADGMQVVCQKLNGTSQGYMLYLMPTLAGEDADIRFSAVNGPSSVTAACKVKKGTFNNVCAVLNKETSTYYAELYVNGNIAASSTSRNALGNFNINTSDFLIGSGTAVLLNGTLLVPQQTLSGTLDELRVFHSVRSVELQRQYASKSIFAQPELKLYYKFNEPPPPLSVPDTDQSNAIVIDSSGNSLHSYISNFFDYVDYDIEGNITGCVLRQDASKDVSNPIVERAESKPVLFPAHNDVVSLNTSLLAAASDYDKANPNLITRLVPQHYLLEGTLFDGQIEPEGTGGDPYGGSGIPGQGKLGSVQLMLSLLYIWARFFDEMKLFVDAFSSLHTVDYNANASMPNNFLRDLIRYYGFEMPPLFSDSSIEQYINADNIGYEYSVSETPLKQIQNELLRRILINMPDVIKSKGTQHSIKSFLRAVGIDPDNSMRLREYGGPTTRQLTYSRESKRDVGTMVAFLTSSLAVSPYLSSSRTEPGYPPTSGMVLNGHSNELNDGLLTSGSWTVEATVKYPPTYINTDVIGIDTQSLVRLCVTGSATFMQSSPGVIANVVAVSSSNGSRLSFYVRPGMGSSDTVKEISISFDDVSVFDGDKWNVCFGCQRNDSIGSVVSSSYFLRAATQNNGDVQRCVSTASYFNESLLADGCSTRALDAALNASGAFICVGQNQLLAVGNNYLNGAAVPEALATNFNGMMSHLRFWSKALIDDEWTEHVRNHKSLGVVDPLVNYNFVTTRSGSFERVRMDTLDKQDTMTAAPASTNTDVGDITFLDFSLNNMHMRGTGFAAIDRCIKPELYDVSYISPNFDEAVSNEKVRIRSFIDKELVNAAPWSSTAPVYEIVRSEEPTDDTRFSIEFSLIDALNRDIVTMFATLASFDNALGSPELVFSPDYPDLESMRNIYFNRLREKLNYKAFYEFFRWFDTSIGSFIKQLIPRKTRFGGTNYVIESHMLERHKLEYMSSNNYMLHPIHNMNKDALYLQQIIGTIHKR